jgi:two-component system, sensor histidine kinase RegB
MVSGTSTDRSANVDWLLRLRWGALGGTLSLLIAAAVVLRLEFNLGAIGTLLIVQAISNFALAKVSAKERLLPWVISLDLLLFTALLWLTGGPSNPFNFLYLVYIALAAVILSPRWAWTLTALALAGYGSLFLLSDTTHHMHMMREHLQGMWVAFGVAACFIVYFVQRINLALFQRETQLRLSQAREERKLRLSSLATLAAGAAHELATPLSSIAIISKELSQNGPPEIQPDAKTIRALVDRCHSILSQLAQDSGENGAEPEHPISIKQLIDDSSQGLDGSTRLNVQIDGQPLVVGQRRALIQALGNVLKNALQASSGTVDIDWSQDSQFAVLLVADQGPGMDPDTLSNIGNPFFTTKKPGQGMGLGVFVARGVLEQLGGRLEFESTVGLGTVARLCFPMERVAR